MSSRIKLAWLLTVLLGVLPAVAQESSQQEAAEVSEEGAYLETVDVNIVNVDVFVTDKAGNPITGLTVDDFELYEDGKPIAITNFYILESFGIIVLQRMVIYISVVSKIVCKTIIPPVTITKQYKFIVIIKTDDLGMSIGLVEPFMR